MDNQWTALMLLHTLIFLTALSAVLALRWASRMDLVRRMMGACLFVIVFIAIIAATLLLFTVIIATFSDR